LIFYEDIESQHYEGYKLMKLVQEEIDEMDQKKIESDAPHGSSSSDEEIIDCSYQEVNVGEANSPYMRPNTENIEESKSITLSNPNRFGDV
jgi:hypothetical protein